MASKVFPRWYGLKVGPQTPDVLDGAEILVKLKGKQLDNQKYYFNLWYNVFSMEAA